MKKLLAVILVVISMFACVSLTACNSDTIVVGITNYKPMDYKNTETGEWEGFDYELAQKVFAELGYKVSFREIDWETKIVALNSGDIDCIWNGMTVTDELKQNILLSDVYLKNKQYAVVKVANASNYTNVDSLKNKTIAVENGSAGADSVKGIEGATINSLQTQNAAVMEVAAGTSDVAIIDYTMAKTLTAEGSSYHGVLSMVDLGFAEEEFAIGFRKSDADLCNSVNSKIADFTADGTVAQLAEKYGITNLLVTD